MKLAYTYTSATATLFTSLYTYIVLYIVLVLFSFAQYQQPYEMKWYSNTYYTVLVHQTTSYPHESQ